MNPLLESQVAKNRHDETLRNVMNEKAYLRRESGGTNGDRISERWNSIKRISYGLALVGIVGFLFVRLVGGF